MVKRTPAREPVVRGECVWRLAAGEVDLALLQAAHDAEDDRLRDLVLHGKQIVEITVVPLRPNLRAGCPVRELGVDANATTGAPHAAGEDVAHPHRPTHA